MQGNTDSTTVTGTTRAELDTNLKAASKSLTDAGITEAQVEFNLQASVETEPTDWLLTATINYTKPN